MGSDENDAIGPDDGEEQGFDARRYAWDTFWFTPKDGLGLLGAAAFGAENDDSGVEDGEGGREGERGALAVDEPAGMRHDDAMTETIADMVKGTGERDNPFFWLTAQQVGLPSGLLVVVAGEEAREVKVALAVQPMDTMRANAEAAERAAGRVPKARSGAETEAETEGKANEGTEGEASETTAGE